MRVICTSISDSGLLAVLRVEIGVRVRVTVLWFRVKVRVRVIGFRVRDRARVRVL